MMIIMKQKLYPFNKKVIKLMFVKDWFCASTLFIKKKNIYIYAPPSEEDDKSVYLLFRSFFNRSLRFPNILIPVDKESSDAT